MTEKLLRDFAVPEVLVAASEDPLDDVRRRVERSDVPLAVVVDDEGRRVHAADEHGRQVLIEAWHDTPMDALGHDAETLEALAGGAPGIVLLGDDGKPAATVPTSAIARFVASMNSAAATMGDVLLPGDPPEGQRGFRCRTCGYLNRIAIVMRNVTSCRNPHWPPHVIT